MLHLQCEENKTTSAPSLRLQFGRRSIFPGGSSLASYLITPDDVYGARNQGFSEELVCVCVIWALFTVICAMLAVP